MKHNTIIRIFVVICAVCAVMTVFATGVSAVDLVPDIDFDGGYNAAVNSAGGITSNIPNYNADYTQDVVSGCLSYAYLQSFTNPTVYSTPNGQWRSFMTRSPSKGYQLGTAALGEPFYRHFLMVTTDRSSPSADIQNMYVYFVYTSGPSEMGVKIDAIPEEWGMTGAKFYVSSDVPLYGVEVYQVFFDPAGDQMYFRLVLPPSAFDFIVPPPVYAYNRQPITLGETEQIVYARSTVASGWNDMYSYGDVTAEDTFLPIGAYKWVDAYKGYVNGLGHDQDAIDNAYSNGYDDGFHDGFDEGNEFGYNYGFSLGTGGQIDVGEIISAIPAGAKSIINGALGFEIFGINVAGTLTALLVIAIVAFVVHKFMTR